MISFYKKDTDRGSLGTMEAIRSGLAQMFWILKEKPLEKYLGAIDWTPAQFLDISMSE